MTRIIRTIKEWKELYDLENISSKELGFVPTMGALHKGHASLIEQSVSENKRTVVSIFVNPTQFNDPNDLTKYPKTFEQDFQMLEELDVDFLFFPEYEELYADNFTYQVHENSFSKILCGTYRSGHFDGVLTVVLKLLNIIKPGRAYFGEKDYQQYKLIKGMAEAFFLQTEIIACPTVRDEDGLALSSRNLLLSPEERKFALNFPRLLKANKSCDEIKFELEQLGFTVDYIEEYDGRRLGAVYAGKVRLIDNSPRRTNYKILFKITGSIAAYKSAYLISKLVQNGFEVKVVATDYALKFIGKATLEGLTGNKVYTDPFEEGEMMSHINLNKWADLTIVCPATANTINKLAAGIADNLLTSLFLAHDRTKPYLIAPAMNTLMFDHPATQASLSKLKEWGVQILPTAEGYLACGDTGKGKLLEPDIIFEQILLALKKNESGGKRKLKVLITSGGTKENIDGVRYLSNLSTGKTGAAIAKYFSRNFHEITFVHAQNSAIPHTDCKLIPYFSFDNLNKQLKSLLSNEDFDAVIHLAAVGDYSVESIEINGKKNKLPLAQKLDSSGEKINIELKRNEKIINRLKGYSKNNNMVLVGFKLTNTPNENERIAAVEKLFKDADCNAVVLNDKSDRDEKDQQKNFSIITHPIKIDVCQTSEELAQKIEAIILNMNKLKAESGK